MTKQRAYEILEVELDATDDEIKKSYRRLILIWHPDRYRDDKSIADKKTKILNIAHDYLEEFHNSRDQHESKEYNAGQSSQYEEEEYSTDQSSQYEEEEYSTDQSSQYEEEQDDGRVKDSDIDQDLLEYYKRYFKDIIMYYRRKPTIVIDLRDVVINFDEHNRPIIILLIDKLKTKMKPDIIYKILKMLFEEKIGYIYYRDNSGSIDYERKILIISINKTKKTFTLSKKIKTSSLNLRYDTEHEQMYERTIDLMNYNVPKQLRMLFYNKEKSSWPPLSPSTVSRWLILKDKTFPGADEQRKFVEMALGTPDFAFLDGPPGSGKTTVLAELVFQLLICKKRILVCASTNVAIDNLLEKIDKIYEESPILQNTLPDFKPLRLGSSPSKTSVKYNIAAFRDSGSSNSEIFKNADLVCGTAYAIHKHTYDATNSSLKESIRFDYLILDEASKTTLTEFLVPAVVADRWIISGDIQQLVPYTDSQKINIRIKQLIHDMALDKNMQRVFLDTFLVLEGELVCILTNNTILKDLYIERCKNLDIKFTDMDKEDKRPNRGIILCSSSSIGKIHLTRMIIFHNYENPQALPDDIKYKNTQEYGDVNKKSDLDKISEEIGLLLFKHPLNKKYNDKENGIYALFYEQLRRLQQVVMPSILELFQGRPTTLHEANTEHRLMSDDDFDPRHELLSYQHRMHKDIAEFSRKYVYKGNAMKTSDGLDRTWNYSYNNRLIWLDVKRTSKNLLEHYSRESNVNESKAIMSEIAKFVKFLQSHKSKKTWEIAILPFYNDQMELLEKELAVNYRLDEESGLYLPRNTDIPITIKMNTVDSFQGNEADIVFLSMVQQRQTSFLENHNRINVAVTRARYLCMVVGNIYIARNSGSILHSLAKESYLIGDDRIKSAFYMNRYDDVIQYFDEDSKKRDLDIDIIILNMRALNQLGRYEKIIEYYDKKHTEPDYVFEVAFAFKQLKKFDSAIKLYNEILKLNSNHYPTLIEYSYYLLDSKKYELALKYAKQANELRLNYDVRAPKIVADAYSRLKEYENAILFYKKILDSSPNNYRILYSCGFLYNKLDKYEDALKYLNQALSNVFNNNDDRKKILLAMRYSYKRLNKKNDLDNCNKMLNSVN